jgi:hypothetical protein
MDAACGAIAVGDHSVPVSCQFEPPRLVHADVLGLSLALVIVDTTRTKDLSYTRHADYVAIASCACLQSPRSPDRQG